MKHTIFNIAVLLAFLSGFTSCDNISDDDRYEAVEKPVLPPHSVPKTLLIQEFTGMRCTNCPKGAAAVHSIDDAFPGQTIAVGLHPLNNTNTTPRNGVDLRSEEATVMYDFFKPAGFPCAVFNGEGQSTSYETWFTMASNYVAQPARMTIEAETIYDAATRNLTVDYWITTTEDISDNLSVMVWIMENGIVGNQLNNGEWILEYTHNHVLRASLNGNWGTPLPTNLKNGEVVEGSTSMVINEDWVAGNCQIIVFVFQTDNKHTEQATLVDINA